MLVLSRKSLESVVVVRPDGREPLIKVTVLEIKNRSVRLGFEGAAEVPIHRLEVWVRINPEGQPEGPLEGPVAPIV
jgi:carbon storage regulator CsrA